ncbi:GIY-YIG nuclease family protein [uncultured Aquimarina sp.]|uniref:GIY-YIG nuclease family protein n=1 Tax=uncultured Aquimarina sp. TaxID=575652 RepID=UPI00341FF5FA
MLKPEHQYSVYILSNKKNGTLYIGMTNNLERRIFEHKNKLIEGFSKKYDLNILVYFEIYQYVNDAILREKRLKN